MADVPEVQCACESCKSILVEQMLRKISAYKQEAIVEDSEVIEYLRGSCSKIDDCSNSDGSSSDKSQVKC